MKVTAKLPLDLDMTVEQLKEVIADLPDRATVRGAVSLADRFGTDQYRLEFTWETKS